MMYTILTAILWLAVFYAVCAAGWQLFEKLKVPTAAILGPIALVGAASVLGLPLVVPGLLKPGLSVVMGIMLGFRFNLKLRGLGTEMFFVAAGIVGLSLLAAKTLTISGLPAPTALFAAMPGGIAEISLMSLDFGADAFAVAILQSTRLLLTMIIFPVLARRSPKPPEQNQKEESAVRHPSRRDWAVICFIAPAAALICHRAGVPAGPMLGSMLAVGLYTKGKGITVKLNTTLQKWVQIGVGGLVGLGITRESVLAIGSYIIPILALNLLVVGGALLLAFALQKLSGWDRPTCLLSCSPAGLSPTILLAIELSADSGKVVVFQVLRLVMVLLFAPVAARLLL